MNSSFFFGVATVAYVFSMIIYIAYVVFKSEGVGRAASTITAVGFFSQTVALLMRWKEFHDLTQMSWIRSAPLTNLYESLIFFVWCLILGNIIVEFKYKNRSFGAFVTPVAVLSLSFIAISGMSTEIQPLVPALQSNWLLVHVLMSFLAYAAFAISFSTALMYLILTTGKKTEGAYIFWSITLAVFSAVLIAMGLDYLKFHLVVKNPDILIKGYLFKATFRSDSGLMQAISYLGAAGFVFAIWNFGGVFKKIISAFHIQAGMLDEITYKSIAIGFPIFTLGGLIFGAIWADQAWGVYWSWDPKETWSLITWLVYAFYLHAKYLRGWKGHKIAVVAVIGFVAVIFTYLGVNLLLSGLHAYGSQ